MESQTVDAYIRTIQRDIEETYRSLDWTAIDRQAYDLTQYERVAAFGLMFSETVAMDLQTALGYNKKFIITNINDLKQDEYIRNAREDTLIIIFSESGEFIGKYCMIDDFISKNVFDGAKANVVLITSNEKMVQDLRVSYCILFKLTESLCTHRLIYRLLTDIIVYWDYRCVCAYGSVGIFLWNY